MNNCINFTNPRHPSRQLPRHPRVKLARLYFWPIIICLLANFFRRSELNQMCLGYPCSDQIFLLRRQFSGQCKDRLWDLCIGPIKSLVALDMVRSRTWLLWPSARGRFMDLAGCSRLSRNPEHECCWLWLAELAQGLVEPSAEIQLALTSRAQTIPSKKQGLHRPRY